MALVFPFTDLQHKLQSRDSLITSSAAAYTSLLIILSVASGVEDHKFEIMADQEQFQDGEVRERPRRQFQQYPQRSNASNNWRTKDDSPRTEPQSRQNRQSGAFGSPRTFGGQGQQRETSDTRLYVGNLLYSAQKDDILQFFNENGFNVANISMSLDPETGRNPSYCFVDFENAEDASRAMGELNGRDVLGRTVRISPGVARRQNFEGGEGQRQYTPRSYGERQQGKYTIHIEQPGG